MTYHDSSFIVPHTQIVEKISLTSQKNRELILEHLLNLDIDSRNNRFCGNIGDEYIKKYISELNSQRGDYIFGIFEEEGSLKVLRTSFEIPVFIPHLKSSLIALAHLAQYKEKDLNKAELALSVSTFHRKRGIGSILLEDVIFQRARELNIHSIYCECLYTNRKVQELFKKRGIELTSNMLDNSTSGRAAIIPKDIDFEIGNLLYKRPIELATTIRRSLINY
ncbi:MAG: GNAT family N-acetyltransferase [Nanoarchaeota archaeon]|nr:GNAT family N-acetyltransferase [Nanoarchaeota archaeon]